MLIGVTKAFRFDEKKAPKRLIVITDGRLDNKVILALFIMNIQNIFAYICYTIRNFIHQKSWVGIRVMTNDKG